MTQKQGRPQDAEKRWRRAAEAGHTGAMNNLGRLLQDRGES